MITVEAITGRFAEALPRSPLAVRRFTRTFTYLRVDGPTPARYAGHDVTIVDVVWNAAGTAQLLVTDGGLHIYPAQITVAPDHGPSPWPPRLGAGPTKESNHA